MKVKEQLVVIKDMDVSKKRDCPILHLDTNKSEETACRTIGNANKSTRETIQHYT